MVDLNSIKSFAKKVKEKQSVNSFPQELVIKVVGVTFDNRQNLLRFLTKKSVFKLERDRTNKFDFYAVKVKSKINGIWAQIGFIPKTYSKTISELMDSGVKLFVELECLNGFQVGDGEMEPKGLDIRVLR